MRAAHRVIQLSSFAIGGALAIICTSIWLFGTQPVLHFTETLFAWLASTALLLDPPEVSTTIDNELRFYATLGTAFGLALCWAAWRVTERAHVAAGLMALFFLGGVGRMVSYVMVGAPHPAFSGLMAVELVVPLVVAISYWRLPKKNG